MIQNTTLLNQVWTTLSTALNDIFEVRPMSVTAYMAHYNSVERYFRSNEYSDNLIAAALNNPRPTKSTEQTTNTEERIVPGGELYFNIKNFFRTHLDNVIQKKGNLQDEDFLRFYAKLWESYQSSSQIANGILAMINRNWVTRQQRDGITGIVDIYTTAMQIWQDKFFKESNQALIQTCLRIIKEERLGRLVNSSLIRQVVQSYTIAGFVRSEKHHLDNRTIAESLVTYVNYFEKPFLEETENFYKLESATFLQQNSIMDYARKVYQRLQEEETRVEKILHPTTRDKIILLLNRNLIQEQLGVFYAEEQEALRADERINDLRLLFGLITRMPLATKPVEDDLEKYAWGVGMSTIENLNAEERKDPKIYIETIIRILEKFSTILEGALDKHHGCASALDRAFSKFINDNAVTREASRKSAKSAELLARYADIVLKKGNREEDADVERKIRQIMKVFNYIIDKDVFQKFYGTRLGKRLVEQLSASDENEKSMISKLKEVCGFEYASKLERMFKDIQLSTELTAEYETYCQNRQITVDFSVKVLTLNSWQYTSAAAFRVPTELTTRLASFTNFFTKKYNGRRLECLYQLSNGDLQTRYTTQKYTLHVSTYQITILLLFNDKTSILVQEIIDQTEIERGLCLQILASLLRRKVLVCSQITAVQLEQENSESLIQRDYNIDLDQNFRSNRVRINLIQPIRSVEQGQDDRVNQNVEDERKYLIQAAVVRIMKARQTLKHTELIKEVIPQLTARFTPSIPMIKKCIDILIEKDYLKRDETEKDVYSYVA